MRIGFNLRAVMESDQDLQKHNIEGGEVEQLCTQNMCNNIVYHSRFLKSLLLFIRFFFLIKYGVNVALNCTSTQ